MITLDNVGKKFKLYRRPGHRLLELFCLGEHHEAFWALRHISLEIPRGRTLGIIGQNGAGKSTLLKLITGTLLPTEGSLSVAGRVAALLELGTGFHPEFSGRQNIRVNGQLLGISLEELERLESEIISFSELGPFIDQPLRTYSSGMVMRLGFSIAAALRPEVLIVDEALSVGDARFSQKCTRRIRQFREDGATILFVSHDPAAVSSLCDEAILLHRGLIESRGAPKDVLEDYNARLAAEGEGNKAMSISWAGRDEEDIRAGTRRSGTFQAIISRLDVCNAAGQPSEVFHTGEDLLLRLRILFLTPVANPTIGFMVKDRLGLELYGTNTALLGRELGSFHSGESAGVEVRIPLRLGYGDYSITVAVHEDETHLESCFEWADNAAVFRVREREKPKWSGIVHHEATVGEPERSSGVETIVESLTPLFGDLPDPLPMEGWAPSPFLRGFQGIGTNPKRGPHRWTHQNAWLVCRPASPLLELRIGLECRTDEELRDTEIAVDILGGGGPVRFRPAAEYCALRLPVPGSLAGQPLALHLAVNPSVSGEAARQYLGMEAPAGLAFYAALGTEEGREDPNWKPCLG